MLAVHLLRVFPKSPLKRVSRFDEDLRDGWVLAAAVLAHAPFIDTAAPEEGVDPGITLNSLHPVPCTPDQVGREPM